MRFMLAVEGCIRVYNLGEWGAAVIDEACFTFLTKVFFNTTIKLYDFTKFNIKIHGFSLQTVTQQDFLSFIVVLTNHR